MEAMVDDDMEADKEANTNSYECSRSKFRLIREPGLNLEV
jgi:hypothetical protein